MITIGAVTTSLGDARAQCLEWSRGFELPGFIGGNFASARVNAFAVHDDGSGSALFAGGAFTIVEGTPAKFIAKWDGASWSALSDGLNARALALAVFDDGSGPALYAAGSFTMSGATNVSHVARWNGSSWSALGDGLDSDVNVMAVFDDGSGAALYAGGAFTMSGGTSVSHIAKWDGAAWLPLGSGIDGPVDSLALFDDGSGPALCVGGRFSNAGGSPARIVAKWDGAAWSALATSVTSGATAGAFALAAHDDGSGPALFVGGRFSSIDGTLANNAAKWNGTSWSALDSGTNNSITVLKVFDDGAGPALYAGGTFTTAGGASANRIARWDGAGWSPLASGFDNFVTALAVFDDDSGAGPRLHAGGEFQVSGDAFVNKFARWDGSAWSLPSYGQGVEPEVQSLAVYDDGAGTKLYAGGYFDGTGRSAIHGIAGWDGASWSSVGGGIDGDVHALHVFDDGSGESLFVGGDFVTAGGVTVNHVAKWNGTSWSALGDGFDIPSVLAFTVFDDGTGPALYAGGHFTATTGLLLKRIAKWNGTSWSALGSGMSGFVYALEVYDSGSGPALYAGGAFGMAGGTGASNIARWNGNNWTSIGGGTNNAVGTLKVFDDGGGAGPELFAGGSFTIAGGVAATHLAKWNGSAWSGAGLHADFTVIGLEVFDDGAGDALYAGGNFTLIGGYAASRVAKFDGVAWSALGAGTDGSVVAFAAYDDGTGGGSELYLAGWFVSAGGVGSSGIARWGACRPGTEYCFGDDLDPFVTADCPCGNFGDAGHGCANSNALLGGAHLTATGTTNPNTVLFTCDGIPNNTLCTFFRNLASVGSGSVYGDGVRCLSGTGIRFGQQNSGQNGNPPNTVSSGAVTVAPGATRYYQLQYRNPSGAFCPPGLFNVSNGYRITW